MVSTADPLSVTPADLRILRLGEPAILSPMAGLVQGLLITRHMLFVGFSLSASAKGF